MHTDVQMKYVIKPTNRFADGRPAREQGRRASLLDLDIILLLSAGFGDKSINL